MLDSPVFLRALKAAPPAEVRTLCRVLAEHGFRSWIVGGCVRDILLSLLVGADADERQPGDWDLCTDARPEEVQKLFKKVIPTGIQHGTVTVVLARQHFEVTTLRGETSYTDGRRPDGVFFVKDLEDDLARRDFTVNAIAYDVSAGTLHDPFDGISDLRDGVLRAVGKASERFAEDGLRVMRCARFTATLGLRIDTDTRSAIFPSLESFRKVAQERVRDEWFKALKSRWPSHCFRVLRNEGLLNITAPELFDGPLVSATSPEEQARYENSSERFEGACFLLDQAPADPVFRISLLCALGASSPAAVQELGTRLRLSNAEKSRLSALYGGARLPEASSGYELRRWMAEQGREQLDDVLSLHEALAPEAHSTDAAAAFGKRVRAELHAGVPLSQKELSVSGKDLIAAKIVEPGPAVGSTLRQLLEHALEHPGCADRESLLQAAQQLQTN